MEVKVKGFELGLLVGPGIVLANYLILAVIFPIRRIYKWYKEITPRVYGVLGSFFGFACWFVPMIVNIKYLDYVFNNFPDMQRGSTNDGVYGLVLSLIWGVSFFALVFYPGLNWL
jgi:hypothetical protein